MIYIYKLTDGEKDYYGQTININKRFIEHKKYNSCSSRILDKSKMKIYVIHRLYTQDEAEETEAFYQLNFECVNNNITGRTQKEWVISNKDKVNKNKLKHYHKNKDIYNKKFKCYCGGKYSHQHKQTHIKTKKHQNFINQK